jgi:hypothetical protein
MNETLNEIPDSVKMEFETLGFQLPKVLKTLENNFLLIEGQESAGVIRWVTDSPNWWARKEGSRFVGLTYRSMLQNRCAVTSIDGRVVLLTCSTDWLELKESDFQVKKTVNIYYQKFNLMF